MSSYRITRRISATPAEVFRAFTDPVLVADWMNGSGVHDITAPLDEAGARYTLVINGPWRFRSEVVRSEPYAAHETLHRGPLGTVVRMVATLHESDGATDLELLTDYTMPLGPIGRVIDRLWLDRRPRGQENREVDRLVELVSPRPAVK